MSPPAPTRSRRAAADTADSISSSTSRLSGGGCASNEAGAAELPVGSRDASGLRGVLDPLRHGRASFRGIEERQRARAEAEHRDPERLQELDRRGHVEERLHARGDDQRPSARERGDVGGDVGRRREPAMDSADPTGAEERDPDPVGDGERSADGRRSDGALNRAGGEVSRAGLARLRR